MRGLHATQIRAPRDNIVNRMILNKQPAQCMKEIRKKWVAKSSVYYLIDNNVEFSEPSAAVIITKGENTRLVILSGK